ncbi:hypothetical protein [Hydrocoleum sp. CS-953]|uniref:hypothetical protein n=1 Tax=Hydrocoleum sp. CS-953 TaxID=1671698 RepID=UPI00143E0DE2|nr:hypothetical protein [Hydrocoleum sp. CS-953]
MPRENSVQILVLNLSNNKKSNQLSYRNHPIFFPNPYSLLPAGANLVKICQEQIRLKF